MSSTKDPGRKAREAGAEAPGGCAAASAPDRPGGLRRPYAEGERPHGAFEPVSSVQTRPRPSPFLRRSSQEAPLPPPTTTEPSPNSPNAHSSLLRVTATLHGLHRPEKRARDRRKRADGARCLPRGQCSIPDWLGELPIKVYLQGRTQLSAIS